jgi:putative peptide zinc metalloprotease protein
MTEVAQPAREAPAAHGATERPHLADGVEVIGRYQDSGLRKPVYLARRPDGQVVQLSELLYLVAVHADGRRPLREIATRMSAATGRNVTAEAVRFLVDERLRPAGVLAEPGEAGGPLPRADPLLAVRLRATLVPPALVGRITGVLRPLFVPRIAIPSLLALVAFDAWLFFDHGLREAFRQLPENPATVLLIGALTLVSVMFHELGHATGCRYGGAKPGAIGVGVFLVWPALFTDLTDTYRLGRVGRLRADLGGMYFNALFALAAYAGYLLWSFEPLLVLVVIQHLEIATQALPLLRLDGYYVLSDLTGVPDILSRARPALLGLLPSHRHVGRTDDLKPWVRRTVVSYLLVTVPVLLAIVIVTALNLPAMVASAADTVRVEAALLVYAWQTASPLALFLSFTGAVLAALPIVGVVCTVAVLARRLLKWWRAAPPLLHPTPALAREALRATGLGALALYISFFLVLGDAGPQEAPLLVVLAAILLAVLLVTAWSERSPDREADRRLRYARERRGF